jgi:fatty-acyl-CoA synthase
MNIFEQDLPKNAANYAPLSPISFVERAAEVFGDLPAVIHGQRRYSWAQCRERSARLGAALQALGAERGVAVSLMLPNTPEMIEAHYAIPAIGAVINALNTRLDAPLLAWQMHHCEARVLITDSEFAPVMAQALRLLKVNHGREMVVIDVCDSEFSGTHTCVGSYAYEALLAAHAPLAHLHGSQDEWDAIAISYTSGTTGDPKGVVTHHRGAYLNAVNNAVTWSLPHFARYLWTLPMFHCNGWCFPWTIAMQAGTHICLRRVETAAMLEAFTYYGATHYCAAPVVHNLLIAEHRANPGAFAAIKQAVKGMVAAASPPASMIEGMAKMGFDITHVYGLTEVYGPASVCAQRESWASESLPSKRA